MEMFSVNVQLELMSKMIESCAIDVRDEWPTKSESYTKSESISRGAFGIIRFAQVSDPRFVLDGLASRSCVVKTVYLRRRIDAILRETATSEEHSGSGQQPYAGAASDVVAASKLTRLHRRTVMELFILSRCRHANIMHLHAVFITDNSDMHLVLPRFYVLQNLIQMYKRRKQSEPIPIGIIAKILRQLCAGLDFLQRIGIAHRDVQPENIFLSRNGTVKLGHFTQARAIFEEERQQQDCCTTPVGREEFMCFEKQHNLYLGEEAAVVNNGDGGTTQLDYSYPADMWSLGVLVLAMVSYFPEEPSQKLHKNFAMAMHEEQMPFIWLTVDMLQLRSRLVKSGGEELKLFLSDRLLTVRPEQRATAASLPKTVEMRRWCMESVEQDSAFLRKHMINELDFANQMKLETDAPNYDVLETKDIPAEFYWDDTWRRLEEMELCLQLFMSGNMPSKEFPFKFSQPEPLFRILYRDVMAARLELTDLLTVDHGIKQVIYEFARQNCAAVNSMASLRRHIELPTKQGGGGIGRHVEVEIRLARQGSGRLRLASESP